MSADDYAVVVGINFYPKLPDHTLYGPVNDARAFAEWLGREDGGDVPAKNIITLLSEDPFQPIPDDNAIIDAVNSLLEPAFTASEQRCGRRLYLFFAGHGFQSAGVSCALMATATLLGGDNLGVSAYIECFKNSGWFDEIILIVDCCRTFYNHWVPQDKLRHPSRTLQREATWIRWFAAPIGREAREAPPGDENARGIFTQHLLRGLDVLAADGEITLNRLVDWMRINAPPDPYTKKPLVFPYPENSNPVFRIIERSAFNQIHVRICPQTLPAGTEFAVLNARFDRLATMLAPGSIELNLKPGLYKLVANDRLKNFEVPPGTTQVLDVGF